MFTENTDFDLLMNGRSTIDISFLAKLVFKLNESDKKLTTLLEKNSSIDRKKYKALLLNYLFYLNANYSESVQSRNTFISRARRSYRLNDLINLNTPKPLFPRIEL